MSIDSSDLKSISSKKDELKDIIPQNSPSYQFCKKKSEINDPSENGWTPIYRAIISNSLEALKDLLKLGGNPNICNNLGETPLYLCVDMNNIEAFNILLNNNPKPNCNIQKRNGDTALHLSIKKKRINFTKILLENNADPNIPNKLYSQTPIHLAIINKLDESILEQFKMNNADIYNLKDKYDKTAYDYSLETNDENYIKLVLKIFGEKIQRRLLYNNLNDDTNLNKSSNIKKSNNKKNQIENILSNSNSNNKQILNNNGNNDHSLNYDSDNINGSKDDKEKIKEIILSEVNKINISELSLNNNYSTPKDKYFFLNYNSNSNVNSNSKILNYANKVSPFLTNNSQNNNFINSSLLKNKNINEANPLEMMNEIIKSSEGQNKFLNNKSLDKDKIIDNISKKKSNNKNEMKDSLEFNKHKMEEEKNYEEITEFEVKENIENKGNKNKGLIIPKINLLNVANNNKNTRNKNNIEIYQSIINNKKRKSFGSNYSNIHYDSTTNANTSRGSFPSNLENMKLNNNDIKVNYINLTEANDLDNININYIKNPNKTKTNTNYKTKNEKYLLTEEEFNNENKDNKNNKNIFNKIKQNEGKNIPTKVSLSKLRDWLISCDLISYYNILKNNSSCDIDQLINNLKNGKKVTYREIENFGIRKPGHIFRFLIKLEIDANIIDYNIHSKIINKFNSNILSTMGLTASNNELKCCGMTIAIGNKNNNNSFNASNYSDIFHFLQYLDLMKFKENFIHNGFDQVDYIILQLFSEYRFDKIILKEFLHIYDENDKKKVINIIYEEKKNIAKELGIYIDENEKEIILNTQVNDDDDNKKCFIF